MFIVCGYIFKDHSWCQCWQVSTHQHRHFFSPLPQGTNTCISWKAAARQRAEEKLTVSGGLVLVFGGVGTVSSRRAGAHAEDVPGGWFQTGDDHAGSLGSS